MNSTKPSRTLLALVVAIAVTACGASQESRPGRVLQLEGERVRVDDSRATFEIETNRVIGERSERHPGKRFHWGIYPTFEAAHAEARNATMSLFELDACSSELDDAVMAAFELAMDQGVKGRFEGRKSLLDRLGKRVCEGAGGPACAFMAAAAGIGGREAPAAPDPAAVAATERRFRESFSATPSTGIYSSTPALDRIFQQAKFLQQTFEPADAAMAALRSALAGDAELAREYRLLNDLASAMTSWLTVPHLLEAPGDQTALFPASRSPEGDFIKETFGQKPVPDGMVLIREVAAAVKRGKLNLAPGARAGWYDRRLFALEPLVRPQAAPVEAWKIVRGERYSEVCADTFVALVTRRRETHVKQLEEPAEGAAFRPRSECAPAVRLEPHPTVYARTAESYAALWKRLGELGATALLETPLDRPIPRMFQATRIGDALLAAERYYRMLEAASLSDLGAGGPAPFTADAAGVDPRVMVPLAYDADKGLHRCLAVIGVRLAYGEVAYATRPVLVREDGGPRPAGAAQPVWTNQDLVLALPVVEEVLVKTPLTREEFRKLCDENGTHEKIWEALSRLR